MARFKIKYCVVTFLLFTMFFISSLIVSISFLQIAEDSDSFDVTNILEEAPGSGDTFEFKKLHQKFKSVQSLQLKKLKTSKYCRFHCKPAMDYFSSGARVSIKEADPEIQIMITHCMHCLKEKGFMSKIRERSRWKKETLEQMKITPLVLPTQPMSTESTFVDLADDSKHNIFGGWLSSIVRADKQDKKSERVQKIPTFKSRKLLSIAKNAERATMKKVLKSLTNSDGQKDWDVEDTYKKNFDSDSLERFESWNAWSTFRSRKLLNVIESKAKRAERKVLKSPKKSIAIGRNEDDDYENNYEDNFDSDIPDLEKHAQKVKNIIKYFLIGCFIFCAILFMFVLPIVSFVRLCLKDYDSNALIVKDVLCCRDPKYKLVKEMCDRREVPIARYKVYRKLMKFYEAKDAETVAKEKAEQKQEIRDESDV